MFAFKTGTPYISSNSETFSANLSDEKHQLDLKDPEHSPSRTQNIHNETCLPSGNNSDKPASCEGSSRDSIDEAPSGLDPIASKVPHPSRTLYYPSLDKCVTLEADLQVI